MVVRARVDDRILDVGRDGVAVAVPLDEPAADDPHAEQAELLAEPVDRRGDDPEVLGDQRQVAELAPRRPRRAPLPARGASGPRAGSSRPRGTAQ